MPVSHEVDGLSACLLPLIVTSCICADPPASSSAPSPRTERGEYSWTADIRAHNMN